jgi:hypothetical protein
MIDLTTNFVKNGGFSVNSDGLPIIPAGQTSQIVSGDGLRYWLSEYGQCV